ncbi:MAG: GNAT family N-acetyltransferase [Opitutales bacterium]|jgi:GNAT superfamily N-acetyltransferase
MNLDELHMVVGWAADEGWNPGLNDAYCFYSTDPGAFLMGVLDDKPVGSISAVSYGTHFGFLGLFIVLPPYRRNGYGQRLWKAAMARMEGRCAGLDAVTAQQANYEKSGFARAYLNIRHAGRASGASGVQKGLVALDQIPFESLCAYDRRYFPSSRMKFLKSWTSLPDSVGLACQGRHGTEGYGVIRPCRNGYKIGPLFADDPERAESLFNALQGSVPKGSTVFLDTPEVNPAALELAHAHGMVPTFEVARMYRGVPPAIDTGGIFGVTTFELG